MYLNTYIYICIHCIIIIYVYVNIYIYCEIIDLQCVYIYTRNYTHTHYTMPYINTYTHTHTIIVQDSTFKNAANLCTQPMDGLGWGKCRWKHNLATCTSTEQSRHSFFNPFEKIWRFPKIGVPLVIIHFKRIFPYTPSPLGYPQDLGTSGKRFFAALGISSQWSSGWPG